MGDGSKDGIGVIMEGSENGIGNLIGDGIKLWNRKYNEGWISIKSNQIK
jgi:hypothetical protein